MNDKDIKKIIQRNNKIEKNLMSNEHNISEKNIKIQTKKINPFIEIIDSSRLDENIINLNDNDKINNFETTEKIENKENLNCIQNSEKNISLDEEPMTFNPNKKINVKRTLNNDQNMSQRQDNNYLTFKNEDNEIELEKANNKKEKLSTDNLKSKEQIYLFKISEDNFCIDDIIRILKSLIDKMKCNLNKNKENYINDSMVSNSIFVDKIMEIKNDIIKAFDKIIEEEKLERIKIDTNKINYSNHFESKFKYYSENYCLNRRIIQLNEIENIYKTEILNLKKKICNFQQENNNLRKIIQNSQNLFEDLMYKNKLLSSKLIKYKNLYTENK